MQVVVDTSVWSLVLRRRAVPGADDLATLALKDLISDTRAMLIGPVRQELLSGIKEPAQFEKLRNALAAFPDEPLTMADYECAASFFNICRAKDVQDSHTDFLICAVAHQRNLPVFSLDRDFLYFSECLPIGLFGLSGKVI